MADVRKMVEEFLKQLPEIGEVTSSAGASKADGAGDNPLFTALTGSMHSSLKATWVKEKAARDAKIKEATEQKGRPLTQQESDNLTRGMPNTTTCNWLTGKIGQTIGSTFATGQFELEAALKKAGLGEAWVSAKIGARPKFGDVFRMESWHVGVSVKFDGDLWHTAESGQGGSRMGYDVVKRKTRGWDPSLVKGWIDIEILMELLGSKVPAWMQGWWRFEIAEKREFVFFPDRGRATAVDTAPINVKVKPVTGRIGALTMEADNQGVAIMWSQRETDTLHHLARLDYMLGERAAQQIQAFKMH